MGLGRMHPQVGVEDRARGRTDGANRPSGNTGITRRAGLLSCVREIPFPVQTEAALENAKVSYRYVR